MDKALSIMFVVSFVNVLAGYLVGMLVGKAALAADVRGGDVVVLAQLVCIPVGALLMIVMLSAMLPTTYGRATLVTLTASGKKLTAMLKRDHRTLARALFAQMSRGEFDSFERGLAAVITNLRTHLASTGSRSGARSAVSRVS